MNSKIGYRIFAMDGFYIKVDFECALSVVKLIEQGQGTNYMNANDIVNLQGYKGLIKEMKTLDSTLSKSVLEKDIDYICAGKVLEQDPFQLNYVRENSEAIKKYINDLSIELYEHLDEVFLTFSEYTSQGFTVDTTIFLLAGGGIDGFVIENNCYIAVNHLFEDILDFKYIITHELCHILLQRNNRYFIEKNQEMLNNREEQTKVFLLLQDTINEGLASYMANPLYINSQSKYIRQLQENCLNNHHRLKENFILFETLLSNLCFDKSFCYNNIHDLGFSSNFGMPLYYVGQHIVETIVGYLGKKSLIKKLLNNDPFCFFIDYCMICERLTNPNNRIRFSRAIAELLITSGANYKEMSEFHEYL